MKMLFRRVLLKFLNHVMRPKHSGASFSNPGTIWTFSYSFWGCSLMGLLSVIFLNAHPSNPTVISGTAEFSTPSNSQMEVILSDKAIIHWENFSIGPKERIQFTLPNAASSTLQRVVGEQPSEIYGRLQSNGHLYLINPNGILFHSESSVEAASFIASTLNVDDDVFCKNKELLFYGERAGNLTNYGMIQTSSGSIALIGHRVENRGFLKAPDHSVYLAGGGERILLKPEGEPHIFIESPIQNSEKSIGVICGGVVQALQVEINSIGTPYGYAIRQDDIIEAAATKKDATGRVFLIAKEGKIATTGSISAPGGEIYLCAKQILSFKANHLAPCASISTSSPKKGGAVYIGYDFENKPYASSTWLDADSKISADTLKQGNGGSIKIYGEHAALLQGILSAKGGSSRGNGGNIEVSTLGYLGLRPQITTQATRGRTGNLVLNTRDMSIIEGPLPLGPNPETLDVEASKLSVMLSTAYLGEMLNKTNVTISTSKSQGEGTGDIQIQSAISAETAHWKAPTTLRLEAKRNINIEQNITCPGRLAFIAENDVNIAQSIICTNEILNPSLAIHARHDINILNPNIQSMKNMNLFGENDVRLGATSIFKEPTSKTALIHSQLGAVLIHNRQSSIEVPAPKPASYLFIPDLENHIEEMAVVHSQIFYRVNAIADQVSLLSLQLLYDRAAYLSKKLSGFPLNFNLLFPYMRHKWVESTFETSAFE